METVFKDYAAFEQAMNEQKLYLELDYEGICSRIGADSKALDHLLTEELGYDGKSLVEYYRSNYLI